MSRDVLEFATIQGARACGLEALTGSLTPGKEADIVLLDTDSLNLMPLNNPYGVVVECAHAGNVDTVMPAGEIVKRDRACLASTCRRCEPASTPRATVFSDAQMSRPTDRGCLALSAKGLTSRARVGPCFAGRSASEDAAPSCSLDSELYLPAFAAALPPSSSLGLAE
jgi:hypothetical protein